jgi:hypothetical protein
MFRDELIEYLAWTIFNAVSYPPDEASKNEAWNKLTAEERGFAAKVWLKAEELENRDPNKERCPGCGMEIDTSVCWCGEEEAAHSSFSDHMFIPMGCKCYQDTAGRLALNKHMGPVRVKTFPEACEKLESMLGEKEWEIWAEGFAATGESGTAQLMGRVKAKTFKEACRIRFKDDRLFNEESLTHWGCRLFDNEVSARKSFG